MFSKLISGVNSIFFLAIKKMKKYNYSNKFKYKNNFNDINTAFFYISLFFFASNIHYSPTGLTTNYIITLIILIPTQINEYNLYNIS